MGCGESKVKPSAVASEPARPVWECEVAKGQWVPYEAIHQYSLEEAYAEDRRGSCTIQVRVIAPPAASKQQQRGRGARQPGDADHPPPAPPAADPYGMAALEAEVGGRRQGRPQQQPRRNTGGGPRQPTAAAGESSAGAAAAAGDFRIYEVCFNGMLQVKKGARFFPTKRAVRRIYPGLGVGGGAGGDRYATAGAHDARLRRSGTREYR